MIKRYSTGRKKFRVLSGAIIFLCAAAFLWVIFIMEITPGKVPWRDLALLMLLAFVASLPFFNMTILVDRERGTVTRAIGWLRWPLYRPVYYLDRYNAVVVEYSHSAASASSRHGQHKRREVNHIRLLNEHDRDKSILIDSFENDRDGAFKFAAELASYLNYPLRKTGFD